MYNVLVAILGILLACFAPTTHAGVPVASLNVTPWNMGETINFGNVAVGTTSAPPQVTTLTANGSAEITNIRVVGSSDFHLTLGGANCANGAQLSNTESCSFPTVFSPSTAGTQGALLNSPVTLRVTCQTFGAITAATVVCNGVEQTIVGLFGNGFVVSQVPALGQWAITLLSLAIFGLAVLQLRKRA